MKAFNMLSRVRTALREGWADPIVRYGCVFDGYYELNGSRVFGAVSHLANVSKRPPISVVVTRNGEPLGSTNSFEPWGEGWRFEIDAGRDFVPDDILKERLRVVVLDRVGGESEVKISGSTQLRYIRSLD